MTSTTLAPQTAYQPNQPVFITDEYGTPRPAWFVGEDDQQRPVVEFSNQQTAWTNYENLSQRTV